MTKLIKYVLIAAATVFASCINDSDMDECGENLSPTQPVGTFDADGRLSNSDVEIRLSAGSGTILNTRAPITESGAEFSASGIGIFCLATSHLNSRAEEFPIDWRAGADAWSVWIDNAESKAIGRNIYISTETEGEEKVYYYPNGNLHCYSFYAYYPRKDAKIKYCKDKIIARINLDGTQDIMWGKSQPDQSCYENYRTSYSALYFHKAQDAQFPRIKTFNHKMARLDFKISSTDDEAENYRLASIELLEMPQTAILTVADNVHVEEGFVDYCGTTTYTLKDENDEKIGPCEILSGQEIVGHICIPAVKTKITMRVILEHKTGKFYSRTYTILPPHKGDSFVEGYYYGVPITVGKSGTITVGDITETDRE